jgi:hypothetical protein
MPNISSIPIDKIFNDIVVPKVTTYTLGQKNQDYFNNSSISTSVEPFDISTGITSDSPEIISMSDFKPVYTDSGDLNDLGKSLQLKQQSIFTLLNSSLDFLLNSIDSKTNANFNKIMIKSFCDDFGQEIDDLLNTFSTIKKKLDCRYPLDTQVLANEGLDPQAKEYPETIENILMSDVNLISGWTSTKSWIQLCFELKEIIKQGLGHGILVDSNSNPSLSLIDDEYKSPYQITPAKSSLINKFGFNAQQNYYPNNTISGIDQGSFYESFKNIFNNNIFTKKIFSESDDINVSIARLAYVLSREYVYSTKMDKNILAAHGYTLLPGSDNSYFWDYVIGQAGSDITDINPTPLDKNSLIGLCQSKEGNSEVLSFEDRYIVDDIGTKRTGIVLTPGTYYYLESSINSTNDSFDTSRISNYISKLDSCLNFLNFFKSEMCFRLTPWAYASPQEKIDQKLTASGDQKLQDTSSLNDFEDPLSLLRAIEQNVLVGTELLNRPRPITFSSSQSANDISGLLISLAVEDEELKSLLFIHQINRFKNNNDVASANNDSVVQKIMQLIENKFGNNVNGISDINVVIAENFIEDSLSNQANDTRLKILNNIGNFLNDFNLKNNKPASAGNNPLFVIANQSNAKTTDFFSFFGSKTTYSGIQNVAFLAGIFNLCCLVVHLSNPDRIVDSRKNPSSWEPDAPQSKNFLSIKKVKEPIYEINAPLPVASANAATTIGQKSLSGATGQQSVSGATGQQSVKKYMLTYDKAMVDIENMIMKEKEDFLKIINTFFVFVKTLHVHFTNLLTSLNSGIYNNILKTASDVIKDPALTRLLMSKEQLSLVRNKMHDVAIRSDMSYSSPVKQLIPYFIDKANDADFDSFLPIEDSHVVAWNFFLKDFLNGESFRETQGFNKKIISVGLPQKLYRRLQMNANDLSSSSLKNGIIKIKLYKNDLMRPALVYKPLSYIFDLNRYPTRILNSFTDISNAIQNNQAIGGDYDITKVPALELKENGFILVDSYSNSFISDYSFLDNQYDNGKSIKELIYYNHTYSFLLEYYLSYMSDVYFDEQKYYQYGNIKSDIVTAYQNFLNSIKKNTTSTTSTPTSIQTISSENTFTQDSFLTSPDVYKASLITPRKFDRVFNIIFDPDDFYIDYDKTVANDVSKTFLNLCIQNNFLYGNNETLKRKNPTMKNEITYEQYWFAVETYDES